MTKRAVCVHKLLSFAMTSGEVKNLQSSLELDQHRHYEVRIAEYSTLFKFEFVVEFDILFTRLLFDGPAKGGFASWTDPAHELFNKVFLSQSYTRIGEMAPRGPRERPDKGNDKDTNQNNKKVKGNKKGPPLKDKKGADELCANWNYGHCGEGALKKNRDGTPCTRKHACKFCLADGHRLKDCDDYKTAQRALP